MLHLNTILCLTLVWLGVCRYSTAIEFVAEPFDTIVNYGDSVILRCAVKDQGKNPLYWQNTDTQQFISMDREIDPYRSFGNKTRERLSIVGDSRYGEYNLRIDNVTNLDAGSYACLYFVVFGYYSRPAEIKVVNPPMKDYPMCMSSPSTPAAIGDDVDLLCVSSGGKPAPMLTWTTGDTPVPSVYISGGVGGVTSNKHSITLTEDDRGKVFTCKATHEAFNVPKTCSIIPIGYNIPVYLRPKIKYSMEGRRATFACYTDKSLEPTFHWYLGNTLLNINDPRVTPTKDGVSKLKLRNLRINDNGTHVYCVITNRFGANKNDSALLLVFPPYYSADKGTGKGEGPKKETETSKDNHDEFEKSTVSNPVTKSMNLSFTTDRSEVASVKLTIPSSSAKDVDTPVTTSQTIIHQAKSIDTDLSLLDGRTTLEPNYLVNNAEYVTTPQDHNIFEWKPNENTSRELHSKQHSDVIENVIESSPTLKAEASYFSLDVTDISARGQQTDYFQTVDMETDYRKERWKATEVASMDEHMFTTKASYIVSHLKSRSPLKSKTTRGSYTTIRPTYSSDSNLGPIIGLTKQNDEVATKSAFTNLQAIPTKITKALTERTSLEYVTTHTIPNTTAKPVMSGPKPPVNLTSNVFAKLLHSKIFLRNSSKSAPSLQRNDIVTANAMKSNSSWKETSELFQDEHVNQEKVTIAASVPSSLGTDSIAPTMSVTDRKEIVTDMSPTRASIIGSKTMGTTKQKETDKLHKTLHASTLAPSSLMTSNTPRASANIMTTKISIVLQINSTNKPNGLRTYMNDELVTEKPVNNDSVSTSSSTVTDGLSVTKDNRNTKSITNKNAQDHNTSTMKHMYKIMKTGHTFNEEAVTAAFHLYSMENKLTTSPSTGSNMKTRVEVNTNATVLDFPMKKGNISKKETSTKDFNGSVATFSTRSSHTEQTQIRLSKMYNPTDKIETTVMGTTINVVKPFNSNRSEVNTTRNKLHKEMMQSKMVVSEKPYSNNSTTERTVNIIKMNNITTTNSTHNSEEINTSSPTNTQTQKTDWPTLKSSTHSEKPAMTNVHELVRQITIAPSASDISVTTFSSKSSPRPTGKTENRISKIYNQTDKIETTVIGTTANVITVAPSASDIHLPKNSIAVTASYNLAPTPTKESDIHEPASAVVQPTYESANLTDISMTKSTSTFRTHVSSINPITAIVRKIVLNSTMNTVSAKVLYDDKTTPSNSKSTENAIVNENKSIRTALKSVRPTYSPWDENQTNLLVLGEHQDTTVKPVYTMPTLQPNALPFGDNDGSDKIHPVKISGTVSPPSQSDIYESLPLITRTTLEGPESSNPNKLPKGTSSNFVTRIFTVKIRKGPAPNDRPITVATVLKTKKSDEKPIKKPGNPVTPEEEANKANVRRNGKIIMASIVGMAVFSAFILTIFSILVKCCSSGNETHHQPRRWT